MHIWLVKAGEAIPGDQSKDRLRRMGLLAEQLTAKGHKVTWFNSTFYHARKIQRFDKDTQINVSANYDIQLIKANSYKRNISVSRAIHHIITANKFYKLAHKLEKPDVILCSMPTIELAEAAVRFAKEQGIPVIIDIRDLWPDIFIEVVPKPIGDILKPYIIYSKRRLYKLLSKADGITSLTDSFLAWGLQYAKRQRSSIDRVFAMAYGPGSIMHEKDHDWRGYGIEENDFLICFFGTLGKQFEFGPVIDAAKRLQGIENIKFVICGDGESMLDIQEKSKPFKNIIFTGWINQSQLQSLLRVTSLGLAPYRESKNFTMNVPNKFSEYLSAGIPILLGIHGEMGRLVNQFDCGYTYDDGKHLAELISSLYTDQGLLESMHTNARKLYAESYDSVKVYQDMSEYLEEVSEIKPGEE